MIAKGKTGTIACLVHFFEIVHQGIVTFVGDSAAGSKKNFQTGIVKSKQFLKGVIAPLEQTHIRIYRVAGDAQSGAYSTVAVTV